MIVNEVTNVWLSHIVLTNAEYKRLGEVDKMAQLASIDSSEEGGAVAGCSHGSQSGQIPPYKPVPGAQ